MKFEAPDVMPTEICADAWNTAMVIDTEVYRLLLEYGLKRREGRSKMTEVIARMVQLSINRAMHEPQQTVDGFVRRCFGDEQADDPKVRALRLVEESVEFAQAVGVDAEKCAALVRYVYARPAGEPLQELGGVAVTSLAAATAIGVTLPDALKAELARVLSKSAEHFAERNKAKCAAGFGPEGGAR